MELAPAFLGDASRQRASLEQVGIDISEPWGWTDTLAAHKRWARHVDRRRRRQAARRPVADILIGAFASNRAGLLSTSTSPKFPLKSL